MRTLFATVSGGLEELLKTELIYLGAQECRITVGGVSYSADKRTLYKTLLWTRLASRILLPIAEFDIQHEDDVYQKSRAIDWPDLIQHDARFAVFFQGTNDMIRNSQYGALKIKDAIVDRFRDTFESRPDVDKRRPDIRIVAYLRKNRLMLSLDLSGDSLHQRNYRWQTGKAPLKETLAAAIVIRSGWKPGIPLVDPLCGSGTLLIEAAMQSAHIAPGLNRVHYGFFAWKDHDAICWDSVKSEAKMQVRPIPKSDLITFFGFDKDPDVIQRAQENAERAGVGGWIDFVEQDISALQNPSPHKKGVVLTNPPYGERLESEPALVALHTQLGERVKACFSGWQLSVFSASPSLLECLHLRASRQFKAKNGPLDCVQKNYSISYRTDYPEKPACSAPALDFANRLKKNEQKLAPWAEKEGIEAYRLYDADLPEYNVAIDRYKNRIVIQEYAAPKTIDAQKARKRLFDLINATIETLGLTADQVISKTRQKQKGSQQYQTLSQKKDFSLIREYNAQFWVNLTDYLDTGLFLDHRLVRKMIGDMASGKRFLNLFAYTGAATVYAALGGAIETTTVDMSRTYLTWAERNFHQNGIKGRHHHVVQADCLRYLRDSKERFDLIFLDPPTFSNSKRMEATLDVQRDHVLLLNDAKRLLNPGGMIIFSNNRQGFKIDDEGVRRLGLHCTDITARTIPVDFKRNKHIHYCFLLKHISH